MTMVSLCMAAVLLAGCDGNGGRTEGTLPPEETTTSSTAVSYEVPAVIDAAYVSRVMAALDHVYGDAVRHLAKTRHADEEFLKYLVAIYTDRFFRLAQDAWVKDEARGFPRLASSPGDPVTTVQDLVRADPGCVVFAAGRDFAPTTSGPPDPTPQRYVGLVPIPPGRDAGRLNPTPWAMSYDGFTSTGSVPEDPCRAT